MKKAVRTTGAAAATSRTWPPIFLGGIIIAAAVIAYIPALNAGFIWDDGSFITDNPTIKSPGGLRYIWFSTQPADYFPLTSTTIWIEWRLWGDRYPAGYHALNILLHSLGAVLLWRVLRRLRIPGAWLAALIFAAHPVTVSSVAWVTERKNTLSLVFYGLSLLLYLRCEDEAKRGFYVWAIIAFLLAMLAKTSVVMLPVVILLCAWWRRGKIAKIDLLRVIPFFGLALLLSSVTVWFQTVNSIGPDNVRPESLWYMCGAAGWSFWFYIVKDLFPERLMAVYPRWDLAPWGIWAWLPSVLTAMLFAVLLRFRQTWGRAPLFAFGYVAVTLFPILGFFKMSFMSQSFVADHWQYLAVIGVIALLVGWLAARWNEWPTRSRLICKISTIMIVLSLLAVTFTHAFNYKNLRAFWLDSLRKNPDSWMGHYGYALEAQQKGRQDLAHFEYSELIAWRRADLVGAYTRRSEILWRQGNQDAAIKDLEAAAAFPRQNVWLIYNLAARYSGVGRYDDAIEKYSRAIDLSRGMPHAYSGRAAAYYMKGEYDKALADCDKALEPNSNLGDAWFTRGLILAKRADNEKAIQAFGKAIGLMPRNPAPWENRAKVLFDMKKYTEAAADFSRALLIKPDEVKNYFNRMQCYLGMKDYAAAAADYRKCRENNIEMPPYIINALTRAGVIK